MCIILFSTLQFTHIYISKPVRSYWVRDSLCAIIKNYRFITSHGYLLINQLIWWLTWIPQKFNENYHRKSVDVLKSNIRTNSYCLDQFPCVSWFSLKFVVWNKHWISFTAVWKFPSESMLFINSLMISIDHISKLWWVCVC